MIVPAVALVQLLAPIEGERHFPREEAMTLGTHGGSNPVWSRLPRRAHGGRFGIASKVKGVCGPYLPKRLRSGCFYCWLLLAGGGRLLPG
jgi:hypothetical protein